MEDIITKEQRAELTQIIFATCGQKLEELRIHYQSEGKDTLFWQHMRNAAQGLENASSAMVDCINSGNQAGVDMMYKFIHGPATAEISPLADEVVMAGATAHTYRSIPGNAHSVNEDILGHEAMLAEKGLDATAISAHVMGLIEKDGANAALDYLNSIGWRMEQKELPREAPIPFIMNETVFDKINRLEKITRESGEKAIETLGLHGSYAMDARNAYVWMANGALNENAKMFRFDKMAEQRNEIAALAASELRNIPDGIIPLVIRMHNDYEQKSHAQKDPAIYDQGISEWAQHTAENYQEMSQLINSHITQIAAKAANDYFNSIGWESGAEVMLRGRVNNMSKQPGQQNQR